MGGRWGSSLWAPGARSLPFLLVFPVSDFISSIVASCKLGLYLIFWHRHDGFCIIWINNQNIFGRPKMSWCSNPSYQNITFKITPPPLSCICGYRRFVIDLFVQKYRQRRSKIQHKRLYFRKDVSRDIDCIWWFSCH